jgi:hypothetical protein
VAIISHILSYKKLKHERYKGDQGVILRQFHPRMTVDELHADVMQWLPNAKDRRWKRPYTDLTYLPMQEVLKYLRANGCRFCYF